MKLRELVGDFNHRKEADTKILLNLKRKILVSLMPVFILFFPNIHKGQTFGLK